MLNQYGIERRIKMTTEEVIFTLYFIVYLITAIVAGLGGKDESKWWLVFVLLMSFFAPIVMKACGII